MGAMKSLMMEDSQQQTDLLETGVSLELTTLLSCNKEYRTLFAQSIIQGVQDGYSDAQQVLITARKGIEIFTLIEKNVKPFVSEKQIQKGGVTLYGATITEKKDPDKYDFSVCEDEYYNDLCKQAEKLKVEIKEREAILKLTKQSFAVVDGRYAGDVINPPSIIYGAQNVAVMLK